MSVVDKHDHSIVTLDEHPNFRFIVFRDDDAEDPMYGYADVIEMFVFASGYHSLAANNEGYWINAFKSFYFAFGEDKALNTVRRFAKIFHGWEDADNRLTTFHHTGHSQGDWAYLFVAVTEPDSGTALSYAEEWDMWVNGEVYGVHAELYVECDSQECHGDEESHWSRNTDQGLEFEVVWGIYSEDMQSAAEYYANEIL